MAFFQSYYNLSANVSFHFPGQCFTAKPQPDDKEKEQLLN